MRKTIDRKMSAVAWLWAAVGVNLTRFTVKPQTRAAKSVREETRNKPSLQFLWSLDMQPPLLPPS